MSISPIRVRLAPSPTGYVHLGTLRTALFDYLFAKKNGGQFILRIEDTDQNRFVEGAIENMLSVFKQLNIEFDEGYYLTDDNKIAEKGEYGPYLQSKRLPVYKQYIDQLITQGDAYYCFCSEERLEELRKEQTALKKPPMYDRKCRSLASADVQAMLAQFGTVSKKPVVRQAIPLDGQTVIHDIIYGDITIENKILDDQVLLKSDGFPTYHLAVVVDDHLMQISHVIRGEEWIASTPKHILLYKAFGWEPTQFAHLPLILNKDKSKLSKRQGDVSVQDFLKKGYLKEALLNFVVFLGWNPKTEQEVFTIDQMVEAFDLSQINNAGAVFDVDKLDWMNGLYIRSQSIGELTALLIPYWLESGQLVGAGDEYKNNEGKVISRSYLEAIVGLERERLKKLSEIVDRTSYYFTTVKYEKDILVWKKSTPEQTKEILIKLAAHLEAITDYSEQALEVALKQFISDNGYDNGSVLWPLRAALTGLPASPGPFQIAAVLALGFGKEEVISRVKIAAEQL